MDPAYATQYARQVRTYYDRNTARFLRWGKDGGTSNLHGALWPPGVTSLCEAMHYSDELVAREIERCHCSVDRILDLGCGVGGSLFYLGRRLPRLRSLTGISLSQVQINLARQRVPVAEWSRFHFDAGCFLQLPADRFRTDFSFSIEAFTHSPASDVFFGVQADLLPPGGRLALIDDFLSDAAHTTAVSARQRRLLDSYRRNWLLPGLCDRADLKFLAEEEGFQLIEDQNLTPYLQLCRPRDKVISLLVKCLGPLMECGTYLKSLVGGDAKQTCYLEGLIHYRLLVFEKRASYAAQ